MKCTLVGNNGVFLESGTSATLALHTETPPASGVWIASSAASSDTVFGCSHPAELERAGTFCLVSSKDDTLVIKALLPEGLSVVHTNTVQSRLTNEELQSLGEVDVLIVPAFAETDKLQFLIEQVDPKALILLPGQGGAEAFLSAFSQVQRAPSSLTLTENKLSDDGMKVFALGL